MRGDVTNCGPRSSLWRRHPRCGDSLPKVVHWDDLVEMVVP